MKGLAPRWLVPRWLALSGLALLVFACGSEPPAEPVARLQVGQSQLELPYPEWRTLRLDWTPLQELEGDPQLSVFVHLLSSEGALVRTFDHPFPGEWKVGETLSSEIQLYQSALGDPLPLGDYDLRLGLYSATGQRWPLEVEAPQKSRFEYRIATVAVPAVSTAGPSFQFLGDWTAETGGDLQVLARQWLVREAGLRIENLEVPGSLLVQILVPSPGTGEPLLPVREGLPLSFEIHSACSGVTKTLEPQGNHLSVLPIFPEPDRLGCEVTFTPSYRPSGEAGFQKGLAALEVVAWSPAKL